MSLRMITDLKPSDFVYSGVTANKYGGKAIYLNGPGRSRLMFQLPALKAIVGLKESALALYSVAQSYSPPTVVAEQQDHP